MRSAQSPFGVSTPFMPYNYEGEASTLPFPTTSFAPSRLHSRSSSPHIDPRAPLEGSHTRTASTGKQGLTHSRNMSSIASLSTLTMKGPPILPLDYGFLIGAPERTHAALAQTVVDLGSWLSVVQGGLSDLLNGVPDEPDTIAEEFEESTDDHDPLAAYFVEDDIPGRITNSPDTPTTALTGIDDVEA